MRLENIAWIEKEQDGKGTTYTYTLVDRPYVQIRRRTGYLLNGYYHMYYDDEFIKTFKTEQELIDHLQKTLGT